MSLFRTSSIVSSRIRINIVEWGAPDAPPLILLHGGKDHARNWDRIAEALAPHYRVIAPDLRGHGDSGWASDGIYQADDYVQDLATLVRELALPPLPMIGHSLGGSIVTRYAALYPDHVTRLVNIEGLGDAPALAAERADRDEFDVLRGWIEARIKVTAYAPRIYPDTATFAARMREMDRHVPLETALRLAENGSRPNADGTITLKYDPAVGPPPPLEMPDAVRRQMWRRVTCPVLLIYGAESWASNPADDGRAAEFPNARVELFENAEHWVQHDQPERFIASVQAFLAEPS